MIDIMDSICSKIEYIYSRRELKSNLRIFVQKNFKIIQNFRVSRSTKRVQCNLSKLNSKNPNSFKYLFD